MLMMVSCDCPPPDMSSCVSVRRRLLQPLSSPWWLLSVGRCAGGRLSVRCAGRHLLSTVLLRVIFSARSGRLALALTAQLLSYFLQTNGCCRCRKCHHPSLGRRLFPREVRPDTQRLFPPLPDAGSSGGAADIRLVLQVAANTLEHVWSPEQRRSGENLTRQ